MKIRWTTRANTNALKEPRVESKADENPLDNMEVTRSDLKHYLQKKRKTHT